MDVGSDSDDGRMLPAKDWKPLEVEREGCDTVDGERAEVEKHGGNTRARGALAG